MKVLKSVWMSKLFVLVNKLFCWFTVLSCRSRCVLKQAARLFSRILSIASQNTRRVCLGSELFNTGAGNLVGVRS